MHSAALAAIATVATIIATAIAPLHTRGERGTQSDLSAAASTESVANGAFAARYWAEWPLEVPQPRTITSVSDAIGALTWVHGEERPRQILDLVWGVNASGKLVNALLRTVDGDGKLYTHDQLYAYERIIFSLDDIDQVVILVGESHKRVHVEGLRYQVGEDGFFGIQYATGQSADGVAFTFGDPHHLVANCCAPRQITDCDPNEQDPCELSCPGTGSCICPDESGSCSSITYSQCRGDCGPLMGCQGLDGQSCFPIDGTNPLTCSCRQAGQ